MAGKRPVTCVGALLAAIALMSVVGVRAAPTAAAGTNPLANPAANVQLPPLASSTGLCADGPDAQVRCPSPCYPTGHLVYNGSRVCAGMIIAAINRAQAREHRAGFTLPSDYFALSIAQQLFVLVNLERISHGVPPLVGLSPYLDGPSEVAAHDGVDPPTLTAYGPVRVWVPPAGGYYALGGAWAGNSANAAAAVFGWFYDDGWGGAGHTWNFACTGPGASGCWGHRDELLGKYAGTGCVDCVAGAGYWSAAAGGWQQSYDFLIVRPAKLPTPLVFTWDGDIVPHLAARWERVRAP